MDLKTSQESSKNTKQIIYMNEENGTPIPGKLDNVIWRHFNPKILLVDNTITEPLQNSGGGR